MRALTIAICVALAAAGAGCAKNSDAASDSGGSTAASAAPAGGSAADTASKSDSSGGGAVDEKTKLPLYPGATVNGSAASNGQAATVLTTADSFDKVYDWYKSKMPAGSEKAKVNAGGMSTASFIVDQNGGKATVAITSQGDKTTISLAQTS
jgi:hypothetical protein